MDYQDSINKKRTDAQLAKERQADLDKIVDATTKGSQTIAHAVAKQGALNRTKTQKVEVVNQPKLAIKHVSDFTPVIKALESVKSELSKLPDRIVIPANERLESLSVNNLQDYTAKFDELIGIVEKIEFDPKIKVDSPNVNVEAPNVDFKPVLDKLDKLFKSVSKEVKVPGVDIKPLQESIGEVKKAIQSLSFPVPNYILPFKDPTTGKASQVTLTSDGKVPVDATVNVGSIGVIEDIQDGAGDSVMDAANDALRVNIVAGSSSGTQYTEGDTDASLTGTIAMAEGPSDTATPLKLDASGNLYVNIGADDTALLSDIVTASEDLLDIYYEPDSAYSAGNKGLVTMGVRRDADTSLVDTDGDAAPFLVNASGYVKVEVFSGETLPISGTVTANLSATDNQVLDDILADTAAIQTAVEVIDNAVATEGSALGSGVLIQGDDGTDRTNILVDTDGHLQVDVLSGGGGGVQYTEDDTDASITGTVMMFESNNTTSSINAVSPDLPLPVYIDGGSSSQLAVSLASVSTSNPIVVSQSIAGNLNATVEGTVTANLSAVDNAVLDTIDAVLDTIKVDTEAIETAVEAIQAGQLADGHNVTVDNASIAVTGTFWQATQPVSGTVTANLSATDNTVLDNIEAGIDELKKAGTSTITSVSSATSSAQALASNADRVGAYFYNSDANICYLKLGTTATTSIGGYTVPIASGGFYELPLPCYTGRIDAIWDGDGAGGLSITEID